MQTIDSLAPFSRSLLTAGLASGGLLFIDAVVLDVAFEDATLTRAAAPLIAPLALLGVVGLYFALRRRIDSQHLDIGFALNLLGFCAISAIAFTRNFVLAPADDPTLDAIRDAFPIVPALIAAGVLASIGFLAFGSALLRHDVARWPSWGYTLLLPASGFGAQMPILVSALVQGLAAVAIVALILSEWRRLPAV